MNVLCEPILNTYGIRRDSGDRVSLGGSFGFARVSMLAPGATRIVTLFVPATVLSLVDTLDDERVRAGHYSVQFGVEGSAEGMPELASLEVDGEDVLIFSYDKLKREM